MASAMSTILVSGVDRQELASLQSRAMARGLSAEGYVKELIDSDLSIAEMARTKTIDEVFASAQRHFEQTGMSDSELDGIADEARKQHQKRGTKRKKR